MNRRKFLTASGLLVATMPILAGDGKNCPGEVEDGRDATPPGSLKPRGESTTTKGSGNVRLVNRHGAHLAQVDNSGRTDVGAHLNALIEKHWDGRLILQLPPGSYLVETPIVVTRNHISIEGYFDGRPSENISKDRNEVQVGGPYGGDVLSSFPRLLVSPSCRDAIQVGPGHLQQGFRLHKIAILGQNGRLGPRPDIKPEQNGIRIMPRTDAFGFSIEECIFIWLTHGILNEHPESTMDGFGIIGGGILECNHAIKWHASIFAGTISQCGFHDMTDTVIELRATNSSNQPNLDYPTKEMVISNNTGWNPGKLVFDIEGFRGGIISNNAFVFNHSQVQCFARLRACHMTHVSGNTFVVDGPGEAGWNETVGGNAAQGFEKDGERYDTLTMTGCSDCMVSANSLISFNRERPVIRIGADPVTGAKSCHNQIALNKILPSTGFEGRPQLELTDGAEANLVLLPMPVGNRARSAVIDHGVGNEICALPLASEASTKKTSAP